MRKTTFLLKEADVVQESSTLHFTDGVLTAMANEWSKIRRYLRELLQDWCPDWPSKFLRCCYLFVLDAGADDVLFFPIKTLEFQDLPTKNTGIFVQPHYYVSDGFVRFNETVVLFMDFPLSNTMEIPHRSWLEFGFSNRLCCTQEASSFWNMQRITANFKNLGTVHFTRRIQKKTPRTSMCKPRFSEKRSFSYGWWWKNILPKPVMQKQDP